ncbi:MAG: S-layer homology domain-containing protein [Acidimicrobiia bacterium]|nr:S-layer homology domain-containing protein [Acidimicrobiia bacterium]
MDQRAHTQPGEPAAPQHRWRSWSRAVALVVAATLCLAFLAPAANAAEPPGRPPFQLPFTCGQTWWGATYQGHSQYWAVDFNTFYGDAWELGQPVLASAPGVVSISTWHQNSWGGGYGHYVVVDHGGGWSTLYAHLHFRSVEVGQSVSTGTLLGGVGGTPSYPVHLHYEQRYTTGGFWNGSAIPAVFDGVPFTYTEFDLPNGYQGLPVTSNNCGQPVIDPCGPFGDVDEKSNFCPAILWLIETELASGYDDGTFRPTLAVSRQAMAAFLWRRAGSPSADTPATFSDVPPGHPFAEPIAWLSSMEIARGFDDGTFRPTEPVSRQAMASFMWQASGAPPPPVGSPTFVDIDPDHPFAPAIVWMAGTGISTGFDDGTFRPGLSVSRQAMAAFLQRAS